MLEAVANSQIHKKKVLLAQEEAELATYEAMEKNNFDELVKELAELEVKIEENNAAKAVKSDEKNTAGNAFEAAKGELMRRYVDADGNVSFENNSSVKVLEPTNKVAAAIYSLMDVAEDAGNQEGDIEIPGFPKANALLPSEVMGDEEVKYGENDLKEAAFEVYSLDAANEYRATEQFTAYVKRLKDALGEKDGKVGAYAELAKAEEALKKATEENTKAKNDYDKTLSEMNAAQAVFDEKLEAYDAAVKEYDAAYEAWNKETDPTKKEALKKVLDSKESLKKSAEAAKDEADGKLTLAKTAFQAAEGVYGSDETQGTRGQLGNALGDLTDKQDKLEKAQKDYDKAVAAQKKFTDAIAVIKNEADYKAYTDRAAKIVETEVATLKTKADEYIELLMAGAELNGKKTAIEQLITISDEGVNSGDLIDINGKIAECKENIETYKADIAKLEMIKGGESGEEAEMLYEDVLAMYDQQIERAEAELAIYEKLAQDYKARLEAAINSGAEA